MAHMNLTSSGGLSVSFRRLNLHSGDMLKKCLCAEQLRHVTCLIKEHPGLIKEPPDSILPMIYICFICVPNGSIEHT